MIRRRIEQPSCILTIEDGGVLGMTQDTYDYISKLKLKIKELENEKHSKWSGDIIGCRKNAVCDDFIQKD